MAFAGGLGLELDLQKVPAKDVFRNDFLLFSESNSRFLIEVASEDRELFEEIMGKHIAQIGEVTEEQKQVIHGLNGEIVVNASLDRLRQSWKKTLSPEEAPQ
jgi:phosphoribosylformylglycinamidine synthase